ncbi:uncharacterized protein I303_102552 [Kwoniella dejecticola CBS 10117]|uniref:Thiaminase-2/PQQC domain-containing protein n=1 Tax=Kwoniella dejecticola CBS 10117 TaxID=1296121 RepID=A0A1A6A926_9TREE|nr:uncharacterized protein I303_02566 [Kwoniella dejecticola CBS 10117]OBR86558.1 hypothetical protein I303_02566 [Kwoniella dejecticola CBS 10117]
MTNKQKFTDYLLEKYADDFKLATQHQFLKQSGEGSIDSGVLKEWLKQDYLFAYEGGIKYTAALLAKISLSPSNNHIRPFPASDLVPILGWSATNLLRETDWFLSVAKEHELEVFNAETREKELDRYGLLGEYSPITRGYIDYLQVIGALGSIEEGMLVLWASEKIYNSAWLYAKTFSQANTSSNETQKALVKFVQNWTTPKFTDFVERCENALNKFELELGSEAAERCEKAFKAILWYEQRFWPDVKAN